MIVKGKILRNDTYVWDGKEKTASRRDSTGGTISGLKFGNEVDVLSAYGDGTDYTLQTINRAITNIESDNVTLLFAPGTWVIDDDLTVASNFVVRVPAGCVFNVSSGKTLTFNGPVIQDHATWTSGSGTVTTSGTRTINGATSQTGDHTQTGDMTITSDLNLSGHDGSAEGLKLAGALVTSSAAELNILDGVTSTAAELNILDGVTSTAAELNILDGVTATAAELNALDISAGQVTGYDRGVTVNLEDDFSAGAELLLASSSLTANTWTTVGPTGSGATYIWTGLDVIPLSATQLMVHGHVDGTDNSASEKVIWLQARPNGSSVSSSITLIASAIGATSGQEYEDSGFMYIPLDANNIFEAYWNTTTFGTAQAAALYLRGWVE